MGSRTGSLGETDRSVGTAGRRHQLRSSDGGAGRSPRGASSGGGRRPLSGERSRCRPGGVPSDGCATGSVPGGPRLADRETAS